MIFITKLSDEGSMQRGSRIKKSFSFLPRSGGLNERNSLEKISTGQGGFIIINLVGKVCPGKEPPPIAVSPSLVNAGISSFFSF